VHLAEPAGPEVDVGPLQGPHLLARLVGQRPPVAVLDDDQGPVPQRELHVPVDQGRERRLRAGGTVRPLLSDRQQLFADGDQHLGEHGVLGREVLVERRPRDAAGGADVGDGDPVESASGEQSGRRGEDLVAAGHGPEVSGR